MVVEEGVKWDRLAERLGISYAQQYNLGLRYSKVGMCYEKGMGVKKDLSKAFTYFEKAADQGNSHAQNNLGMCYKNGMGVKKDLSKAFTYFEKAADKGNSQAQCNLGVYYENGIGVKKNFPEAVSLYTLSANQGHPASQYNLGRCYEYGIGVAKNLSKAVSLYILSAAQNFDLAKKQLPKARKKLEQAAKARVTDPPNENTPLLSGNQTNYKSFRRQTV